MRIEHVLGAAALLAIAGCVTTPDDPSGQAAASRCNAAGLEADLVDLQRPLAQAVERQREADFHVALAGGYADLGAIAAQASRPRWGREGEDALACLVVSARAATLMAYLPAARRPTSEDPDAASPEIAARNAADDAVALCAGGAQDPRRCAIAHLLRDTVVAQVSMSALRDAAGAPASTATATGWNAQTEFLSAFGDGAAEWPATAAAIAAVPGASADETVRMLNAYLPPLACNTYSAGSDLSTRPNPAGAGADLESASLSFFDAFRAQMAKAAYGLSLPLAEGSPASCATAQGLPDAAECQAARFETISSFCNARTGFGADGS
jgi:hypothetical protein